ncbi:hypothetical protein SDC9_176794 [bioreactor metagenome]|uniref:Uncharacterized protein n=1 Tax=bioreactor metagenome TaxID=1076179 RepID=A0A645GR07_9ZZZZ
MISRESSAKSQRAKELTGGMDSPLKSQETSTLSIRMYGQTAAICLIAKRKPLRSIRSLPMKLSKCLPICTPEAICRRKPLWRELRPSLFRLGLSMTKLQCSKGRLPMFSPSSSQGNALKFGRFLLQRV